MAKRLRLPISEARARLFQLTEFVRQSAPDAAVVIEQRGGLEPVVLVRESRLAYLEDRVRQLDARRSERPSLAGSLGSGLDDASLEEVLREIRREWSPPESKRPARPGRSRQRRT